MDIHNQVLMKHMSVIYNNRFMNNLIPCPISRSKLTMQKPIIHLRNCAKSSGSNLSMVSSLPFSVISRSSAELFVDKALADGGLGGGTEEGDRDKG